MPDRSKRNEKERADRMELAEWRKVAGEALSASKPTPAMLRDHMAWVDRLSKFVDTIGLRRKPYFKSEELPK